MKKSQMFSKRILMCSFSCLLLTASLLTIRAAGEVDPTFNPGLVYEKTDFPYTEVNTVFVQPDGKVLIGGFFNAVGKINSYGIARLNADGTVDATFRAPVIGFTNSNYQINAIAVQQDGKIVFGGVFTGIAGQPRTGIARLNPDGSFDASFNALLGNGPNGFRNILDIKIAADNKIVVVGNFTYNSGANRYIARLNSDGTFDSSFNSPPVVNSLTDSYRAGILPNGKILFAGTSGSSSVIYRLNADGSNDASFMPITLGGNPSTPGVFVIKALADGRFYVGGGFSTYNGFVLPSANLLRFNADGSLDTNFNAGNTGPNFTVREIEILPNNQLLVGGDFSVFNGVGRQKIAKINPDGSLDNSISFSGLFSFNDFALLADGKILLGGEAGGNRAAGNEYRPALLKLNADGSADAVQTPIGNFGKAGKVLVQADGKILIGGIFTYTDNQVRFNISRVNADGSLDPTFTPAPINFEVSGIDVRADGKILVSTAISVIRLNANGSLDFNLGGDAFDAKFLNGGGAIIASSRRLKKALESGALDNSFTSTFTDNNIRKVLVQPDGKYIVVGDFTQIGGITRGRIARVNADGTLDATFNPAGGANNSVFDAALQSDGKIIIGGNFTGVNFDVNYKNLARLNANGSLDTSFNPIIVGGVQSLKIQTNGRILIGGAMSSVNGAARNGIARLNQDGSLDAAFDPGAGADDSVLSIDTQTNGNVIIGGIFRHVNNSDRLGVARLLDASARTRFDFDGDGRSDVSVFRPSTGIWYTSTNPAINYGAVQFGIASDKLVPADYDGDGKTDVAVFRDGRWYLLRSQAGFTDIPFGLGTDIPVPADYDGDGKADVAVFRSSNNTWYLNQSTAGFVAVSFGLGTDVPVPADYDGDGRANVAVFRPSNGTWYTSTDPALNYGAIQFGAANDKPVPADYDGDGKTDVAVFRPANGTWYLNRSRDGFVGISFGLNGDAPVAADYDGDGRADVAVFRGGNWYLNRTTQGFANVPFGLSDDKPVPNAFVR